jgi:hypothetical protein
MTTLTCGSSAVISFVAANPSISGMERSISTISGAISRAMATASRPFFASPATSWPWAVKRLRSPSRNSA